ncbi:prepilin-type N-terminal cleavage/methylation domain-containing protein [Rhodoferax sp.]|jgi:general secretion pathway protein H|uniref:prepilin-type N-terminal cleavage/methylation domain-containing protein n=1 Tax=Rhodoferax sp. TaxID=50421 RepID=UPI003783E4EB
MGRQPRHTATTAAAWVVRGVTLLELLVVVSIIAIAAAGVAMALPDSGQAQLEREAQRLASLLESARAQSRLTGTVVRWRVTPSGFRFEGVQPDSLPSNWLDSATRAPVGAWLVLGPEPILAPQGVTLRGSQPSAPGWRVASDGLRPFQVERP